MKKTKRFAVLLLVLALLWPGAAWAADENIFSGGTAVVAVPGREVLFPIEVSGGANLAACKLFILCDTDVFSLKQDRSGAYKVEPGELTRQGTWGANTYGSSGWQISWYQERNVTAEGLLCVLPLEVSRDAPLGTYEITLLCSAENTVDETGTEVPFTTVSGSIEIVSSAPTIFTKGQALVSGMVVDLPIYIRNNPGLTGIHLQIESNEEIEVVLDDTGMPVIVAGEQLTAGNFLVNTYGETGGQAVWFNATAMEEDGLLCTIRVRVLGEPGQEITLPLTYQAVNTLNAQNKPQSLELETAQTVTNLTAPQVTAQWDAGGKVLHVTGAFDVPLDLNQERILPILAFYRNGQLLRATRNLSAVENGNFSLDLPILAPTNGDHDRLSLFCLDPTLLTPLRGRVDIAVK